MAARAAAAAVRRPCPSSWELSAPSARARDRRRACGNLAHRALALRLHGGRFLLTTEPLPPAGGLLALAGQGGGGGAAVPVVVPAGQGGGNAQLLQQLLPQLLAGAGGGGGGGGNDAVIAAAAEHMQPQHVPEALRLDAVKSVFRSCAMCCGLATGVVFATFAVLLLPVWLGQHSSFRSAKARAPPSPATCRRTARTARPPDRPTDRPPTRPPCVTDRRRPDACAVLRRSRGSLLLLGPLRGRTLCALSV